MLLPLVPALVASILDGVEVEFGRPWTRVALAFITYSRAGVNDAEMQDLLSLNDERRFSLHEWLRLLGALEGLLVEREKSAASGTTASSRRRPRRGMAGLGQETPKSS